MKPTKTWILVADGARARIIENLGPGKGLQPALNNDFAASHAPTRKFVTGKPGRNRTDGGGAHHGIEPRVDWHRFEKHRFARGMADLINRAAPRRAFDRLILVAPPETLGALRGKLSSAARSRLAGEITKDLTHIPLHELHRHLGDTLAI